MYVITCYGFLLFRGITFDFAVNKLYFRFVPFFFLFSPFWWILNHFPRAKSCSSQQETCSFACVCKKRDTCVEASEEAGGVAYLEALTLGKCQCMQAQKFSIQHIYFSLSPEGQVLQ